MDVITFPENRFYCMALFHSQARCHLIICFILHKNVALYITQDEKVFPRIK